MTFNSSLKLSPTSPQNNRPFTGSKLNRHGLRMPTAQNSVRTSAEFTGLPLKLVAPTNGLSAGTE